MLDRNVLAPYLPANLQSEVWAIVRGIQDKDKRISVSIDLLAHISEISPIETVEILRGIQEQDDITQVLVPIYLNE